MSVATGSTSVPRHQIARWNPEDPEQWSGRQAWLTLWVTTFSLLLGFMVWYLVSSVAPLLQTATIVDKRGAFWLASMPGLAGGLLRLVWMFLPPMLGTRRMVFWSTLAMIVPMLGWAWILTLEKPAFAALMALAFLTGIGGGIFSGYMPSTSYFFPKAKQGLALGIQAGVGNFGVSVVQLLTPIFVGWSLFGPASKLYAAHKDGKQIWLQSAPAVIIPLLVIAAVLVFIFLKSVPVKANFRQQIDIFGNKHTWLMTALYLLTFGIFSGLAGQFGNMLNNMSAHVPTVGWLGGTTIAFLGAFIGSLARVLWGPFCDRFGGAIWTFVAAIGIAVSTIPVIIALSRTAVIDVPTTAAKAQVPLGLFLTGMFAIFFFAGVGNASTFKQMPMIFSPRQAGGVIGWTAAIAAFGPFIFGIAINALTASAGNFGRQLLPLFVFILVYAVACVGIAWWFYARPGAEAKS